MTVVVMVMNIVTVMVLGGDGGDCHDGGVDGDDGYDNDTDGDDSGNGGGLVLDDNDGSSGDSEDGNEDGNDSDGDDDDAVVGIFNSFLSLNTAFSWSPRTVSLLIKLHLNPSSHFSLKFHFPGIGPNPLLMTTLSHFAASNSHSSNPYPALC